MGTTSNGRSRFQTFVRAWHAPGVGYTVSFTCGYLYLLPLQRLWDSPDSAAPLPVALSPSFHPSLPLSLEGAKVAQVAGADVVCWQRCGRDARRFVWQLAASSHALTYRTHPSPRSISLTNCFRIASSVACCLLSLPPTSQIIASRREDFDRQTRGVKKKQKGKRNHEKILKVAYLISFCLFLAVC